MKTRLLLFVPAALVASYPACSSDDSATPGGKLIMNGDAQGSAGRGGSSSGIGGGTAGSDSGGSNAGGASGGMTGTSTGGAAGGDDGGAGSSGAGGSGGSASSDAGSSAGKIAPNGSMGCGKMNPQTGSGQSPLTVSGHQYYVKLPTNYDASKPYTTFFMFNPTNNPITWAEQSAGFEKNAAKDNWIRVYPHPANSAAGWNGSDVPFFQPLYDQITANFCVDKARVFASGESSGGDFSSILGCEHADKLRGVAPCSTKPVGGYALDPNTRKCTGEVTAVVIHGKNDNVVGPENGPKTRDFYVALNHCSMSTMPVEGYTDPLSNCAMYQGCDANYPVYWCQHQDPNYSGTNHGWPTFAPDFLYKLFSSY